MAPSRKLLYFNFNGYTESIRYLLHYGGLEFEDSKIDVHKWPIMEIKESLPFGQMPLYTEDGRTLNQSFAIARYIASQIPGLLPSDPWEQAQLDASVLNIYDCVKRLFPYLSEQEPEKKEPLKQHLYQGIHYAFSRFEKELKASNGHFGGKLSWADFMLVGAIGTLNFFLEETFQKDYPTLAALMDEIESSPGVKEYLANKEPYVRDFLHVYKYYKP